MERPATDWERLFTYHISDKGLVPRIYKELLKVNSGKTIQLKMGKDLNRPHQRW